MSKIKISTYLLIILFSLIFSYVVQDGLRLVIQKTLEIPNDSIGPALWGDTFFLRILASLLSTATGAFILGTFLKERFRLAAIIYVLPVVLFWIFIFSLGITTISQQGYSIEIMKLTVLLPGILAILSPITAYYCANLGHEHLDEFQRSKSVLNIKWYHWIWIFPFYLNKAIAIPVFTFILLLQFDTTFDYYEESIFTAIHDIGNIIPRFIIGFVLIAILVSIAHTYELLSEDAQESQNSWKKMTIIFFYLFLFSVIYTLLFSNLK